MFGRIAGKAGAAVLALMLCTGCAAGGSRSVQEGLETPAATVQATPGQLLEISPTAAPTARPTAAPTEAPTPEPVTDELLETGIYDSYFDDAVFLGDSITETLKNYCIGQRRTNESFLGTAQFLAAVGMNVRLASRDDRSLLKYRGYAVSVTEGLLSMQAKRVFVLLGVNDIAGKYPEETIEYYRTLIDVIREKCEGIEIVAQAVTPVSYAFCKERGLKVEEWNAFNERLAQLCAEENVPFLDFAQYLMDAEGYLDAAMTGDGMFHLNENGNAVWVRELRRFAAEQLAQQEHEPAMPTPEPGA